MMAHAQGQVLYEGQPVQVAKVKSAEGGKLLVELADGASVDATQLSFPDQGTQELYQVVGKIADSAGTANLLLAGLDEGNASAGIYARAIEQAFFYGRHQIPLAQLQAESPYAQALTPKQLEQAYALGVMAGKKAEEKRDAVASKGDPRKSRKGSVNYGYEGQALDKSKLKLSQKVGVDFTELLARKYGMTTYFYRSYVNENGERVYKNKEGKIVPADESGHYDPSDGSIHIDLNCGDMGDSVMFTIAHELTHFIQDWSPTRYRKLCGILMEGFAQSNQSVKQLILHKQNECRKKGVELTEEQAYDEVIASSMEGVLTDGRVMDLLDQVETIDQSLRDQIKSFFKNVADMIRDTIQAYKNKKPDSPEGRIVQRMDHLREQLQNAFAIGLSEGGYNYQRGGEVIADQSNVKESFVGYADDGKGIYKSNFPKGTPRKAKGERILHYIQNVWSKKPITLRIEQDGIVRYVEAKFDPTFSEDTKVRTDASKLMGGNRHGNAVEKRVTLDLADDYYQIASEAQYNYSKEETGKESDTHKDVKVWHYFVNDIYFAEHDSEELESYRVSINVKEKTDGHFFYSFSAEKMEGTSTQRTLHAAVNDSNNTTVNGSSSKKSIRYTAEKVNKKSVRYQMNAAAQEHLQAATGDMGADVDALKQLVSMLNKQTGMNRLKHGTLDAAASFLMRTAGARGDKQQLMRMLHEFYSYVGQTEGLSWEAIQQEARPIAQWLTDHMVRTKQMSEYAAEVLDTVRHSRIYLDDVQRKEVEYAFGSYGAYRSAMMGSVVLANDRSISLDTQWQEWAGMYPDVFDEDMNATDMPGELMNIIQRMRNSDTSELEFEYNRDFIIQDLTNRVYDSYWNAATLYVVADQYEQKIRQLKGKHKQHMAEVYQRHRAAEESLRKEFKRRTEELEAQYEERYQRREYEYRDSRRKAVERHDKAQIRQQIRKDVERLASLQNKGNKQKNVKQELQAVCDLHFLILISPPPQDKPALERRVCQ